MTASERRGADVPSAQIGARNFPARKNGDPVEHLTEKERILLLAALKRAANSPDAMFDYIPHSHADEFPTMSDVAAGYSSLSEKLGLGSLPITL